MAREARKARELALTAPARSPAEQRPRFRLMKWIEGGDASTYQVPVPDLVPPGFHFSSHPTGDVHLRSPLGNGTARADIDRFREAAEDGTLDRIVATLLVRPARWRSNVGLIWPKDWVLRLGAGAKSADLPLEEFLESLREIELGDSRHLGSDLALVRAHGLLRPLDTVLLPDPRSDGSLYFFNLLGPAPLDLPDFAVPRELPFWRSTALALVRLREFGGVFVLFPEGARLQRIADRVGFGQILRGFSAIDAHLEGIGANPRLEEHLRWIKNSFVPPLREVTLAPPIRVARLRRRRPPVLGLSPLVQCAQ